MTKVFSVQYVKQRFQVQCPFCRRSQQITDRRVKKLMAEHCLDHALVAESDVGPVAVVHSPCSHGRYGDGSQLQMVPTGLGDMVEDLMTEVEGLAEELVDAQTACEDLAAQNSELRAQLEMRRVGSEHPGP